MGNEILKQRRNRSIKKLPFYIKILIYLGVYMIWIEPKKGFDNRYLQCSKFNPYHPIFWIIAIILIPIGACNGVYDMFKLVKKNIKVQKYTG